MSETPYALITDLAGVERMLADIEGHAVIGVDTETTGLDPYRSRVRLLQLATADQSFVIDLFRVPALEHRPLRDLFTSSDPVKARLRANTEELIARGGYGSPTIFVDGDDMYFGNDQLPLVAAALQGTRA